MNRAKIVMVQSDYHSSSFNWSKNVSFVSWMKISEKANQKVQSDAARLDSVIYDSVPPPSLLSCFLFLKPKGFSVFSVSDVLGHLSLRLC